MPEINPRPGRSSKIALRISYVQHTGKSTGSSLVSFPDAFKSSLGTRLHHSAVANHVYTILNIAHDGPSRYSNIARALMVPKIYMQLLYKMISDRTDLQNI